LLLLLLLVVVVVGGGGGGGGGVYICAGCDRCCGCGKLAAVLSLSNHDVLLLQKLVGTKNMLFVEFLQSVDW